jgi:hypothetical protein
LADRSRMTVVLAVTLILNINSGKADSVPGPHCCDSCWVPPVAPRTPKDFRSTQITNLAIKYHCTKDSTAIAKSLYPPIDVPAIKRSELK